MVLPAPLGPEKAEDFAGGDVEVQGADRDEVAISFRQVSYLNHNKVAKRDCLAEEN